MASYIGIDPATNCGWASLDADGTYRASGIWRLERTQSDGIGMRFIRFEKHLEDLVQSHVGDLVVGYDLVQPYGSGASKMIYYGIVTRLASYLDAHGIPYAGVNSSTYKKTAVPIGRSSKPLMVEAAKSRWPQLPDDISHDEADALWIAEALRQGRV